MVTEKRRIKINWMCDKILEKNSQAPMTVNQHIAVWMIWLALLFFGSSAIGFHFIAFKYLFVVLVFGAVVIGSLIVGKRDLT